MEDLNFYNLVLDEFNNNKNENLWLKAKVECLGDDEKAKYMYIKLRVDELKNEAAQNKSEPNCDKELVLTNFLEQSVFELKGSLSKQVKDKFCEIIGVKNFDKVLCSLFVSPQKIILIPFGKYRRGLEVAGALLGGGAVFSVLGGFAGKALSSGLNKYNNKSSSDPLKENNIFLLMDTTTTILSAYDYRFQWDLTGGEWHTRVRLKGKGVIDSVEGEIELIFSFEGKSNERTFLTKPNKKVSELANLLNITAPVIKSEKFTW